MKKANRTTETLRGRSMRRLKQAIALLSAAALLAGMPLSAYMVSAEESGAEISSENELTNAANPAVESVVNESQEAQDPSAGAEPEAPADTGADSEFAPSKPEPGNDTVPSAASTSTEVQPTSDNMHAENEDGSDANPPSEVTPQPTEDEKLEIRLDENEPKKRLVVTAEAIPADSVLTVERAEGNTYKSAIEEALAVEDTILGDTRFALRIDVTGSDNLTEEIRITVQGEVLADLNVNENVLYRIDEQNRASKVDYTYHKDDKLLEFQTKEFSVFALVVPEPKPTASPTPTQTPTQKPTTTPAPKPTVSPTPKPTMTPTPAATPSPTPTVSPTPLPTETPVPVVQKRDSKRITLNEEGEVSLVAATAENVPEDARLVISGVDASVIDLVESSTISSVRYDVWFAVDIQFGVSLTDKATVTLQSEKLAELPEGALLYHVDAQRGKVRKTNYEFNRAARTVTFKSKEFSPYVILIKHGTGNAAKEINANAESQALVGGSGVPTYYPAGDNGTGYGGYNDTGYSGGGAAGFNDTLYAGMNNTNVTGYNETDIAGFNETDYAGENGTNATGVAGAENATGANDTKTESSKDDKKSGGISAGVLIGVIAAAVAAVAVAFGVGRHLQSGRQKTDTGTDEKRRDE